MKIMSIQRRLTLLLYAAMLLGPSHAWGADSELYYQTQSTFGSPSRLEAQLSAGYDFSSPYLGIYAAGGAVYWLANPIWSFGGEADIFGSSLKSAAVGLANELSQYGFSTNAIGPKWDAALLLRFTPLSGMVNLLAAKIMMIDLALIARCGAIEYEQSNSGPLAGLGVELLLAVSPSWGIHANIDWNHEWPGNLPGQWRVGFRIGPVIKL